LDDGADILADAAPAAPAVHAAVASPVKTAPVVAKVDAVAPVKVAAPVVEAAASALAVTAAEPETAVDITEPVDPVVVANLSAAEEALLKRAARFGIQPVPAVVAKVEQTKKNVRAERFGLPVAPAANTNQQKGNKNKNGNNEGNKGQNQKQGQGQGQVKSAQAVLADPELAARLAKRAERFGVVSSTLQQVQKEQTKAEEVRLQ